MVGSINLQSSRKIWVEMSPEIKYPPCPVDPSTKSCERRDANSESDNPVSFSPVEVGVPRGASAVYCLRSTSADAVGGFDTSSNKSIADDAEMMFFAIQLRREERFERELFGAFTDSAVHVAAARIADNVMDKRFLIFMVSVAFSFDICCYRYRLFRFSFALLVVYGGCMAAEF